MISNTTEIGFDYPRVDRRRFYEINFDIIWTISKNIHKNTHGRDLFRNAAYFYLAARKDSGFYGNLVQGSKIAIFGNSSR